MNHRAFNQVACRMNEEWCGRQFGLNVNPVKNGPDLYDGQTLADSSRFAEVKFRLLDDISPGGRYIRWTAQEHQIHYDEKSSPIVWMLGTYRLNRLRSKVKTHDIRLLEKMVTERDLWIIPWDWARQFKICDGDEMYGYRYAFMTPFPKKNGYVPIPRVVKTQLVENDWRVHFTEGVDQRIFRLV